MLLGAITWWIGKCDRLWLLPVTLELDPYGLIFGSGRISLLDLANTQNRIQFVYHKGYIRNNHQLELNLYITKVPSETTINCTWQTIYIVSFHNKLYNNHTNRKVQEKISSTSTSKKEATFSLIAKNCFFSNLVLIIPHVLARSRSQMMSAYDSKGEKIGSKLNHYLQILT